MRELKIIYLFQPKKATLMVIKRKKLVCISDICKELNTQYMPIKKHLNALIEDGKIEGRIIGRQWVYNVKN